MSALEKYLAGLGFTDVWQLLEAHPRTSLVDLVKDVPGVYAMLLTPAAVESCVTHGRMEALVCDLITRGLHSELPGGWNSADDFAHVSAMSSVGLPEPYSSIHTAIAIELLRENPPPEGWLPESRDDERLRSAYRRAVAALPEEMRSLAERNQIVIEPGTIHRKATAWVGGFLDLTAHGSTLAAQLRQVPRPLLLAFSANRCQSEVCNGGFHQFFYNPSGAIAPEAVEGFLAIGMPNTAAIVEEANAFFGKRFPRSRAERDRKLPGVPDRPREEWDPFFALDERFYAVIRSENGGFDVAADAYIERAKPEDPQGRA
jgi:hypothetical protein